MAAAEDAEDTDALLLPFVEALYDASFAVDDDANGDAEERGSSEGDAQEPLEPPPSPPATAEDAQAETPAKPLQTDKKPPARWNPNKARNERKGELIYLRKKVEELEAELSSFQSKRPRLLASSPSIASATVAAAGGGNGVLVRSANDGARAPQVLAKVWKGIAERQSEERVKAERENVRLKLVLENQLKVAKSLEKVLVKKSTAKDMEEFAERAKMALPAVDVSDAELFEALVCEVELLFERVDSIFEGVSLAHSEVSATSARVRSDAHIGVSLEIFASKLLPFGLQATGDAAWRHFTFAKKKAPYRSYEYNANKYLHTSGDMVAENFVLRLKAKGTDANIRCKQVIRRRVEQDRVVIVWRGLSEPFEFSDEPVSGVGYYQEGYIVIKRPSASADDRTLLQSCYVFTPIPTGGSHPRVGVITDFMLASTAAYISSSHQMIENVLIEQALKRNSNSSQVHAVD